QAGPRLHALPARWQGRQGRLRTGRRGCQSPPAACVDRSRSGLASFPDPFHSHYFFFFAAFFFAIRLVTSLHLMSRPPRRCTPSAQDPRHYFFFFAAFFFAIVLTSFRAVSAARTPSRHDEAFRPARALAARGREGPRRAAGD